MICGSGGSKSRLAKAAGAEPAGQMRDEKLHAVVARSTFPSQNLQSTQGPDHFWQLRCRKSARRCGAKHISKSKCTKHTILGPLLEVEMSKKCTPLWREAHFEVKMYKTHQRFGPLLEVQMSKKCMPLWREAHFEVKMLKHQGFGPLLEVQMSKKCTLLWREDPPCVAHYKVDILCAYKVGFRSPLYIPTMGDKAVFCARNMPLDLEDDFITTLAFQFIPGWFPTRKRLNICGNAFYRPLVPFKEWP